MKKLLLFGALLFSQFSNGQALIGRTKSEVRIYYYNRGEYPGFSYGIWSTGDSSMTVESDYYTAKCFIDPNDHKVYQYYLFPKTDAFETAYIDALDSKFHKLSQSKWISKDYSVLVEYKWFSNYERDGYLIKQY